MSDQFFEVEGGACEDGVEVITEHSLEEISAEAVVLLQMSDDRFNRRSSF